MKIDEAIQLLETWYRASSHRQFPQDFTAMKLGIEALKRFKLARDFGRYARTNLLPGETKD